ncbi:MULTISPECIES: LysR family transcriptional regulator [unclassified Pseudomonas]|uniref:LysR family transcriptional regulator n=1 Tax=unclassified Pseudomonas TaxID=196821 RepID=UPI0025E4E9A5|nr:MULTISPECIES: LysR family transcriptional regulator [unclassified Pseudomonas]
MDLLRCIEVFIEVAEGSSFTRAAQRLGMAKGNVTKHVAWLEEQLGVQLLRRTTKSVSLTESGSLLIESGTELLERTEQIRDEVKMLAVSPKGMIKVGAPPAFAALQMIPVVAAFSKLHPDINVALALDDGRADLVQEGLDLTIRIRPALGDTSQVARKLADVRQVLVASPDYLSRHGHPTCAQDLASHACMVHSLKSPTNYWELSGPFGSTSVRVKGNIRADFGEPLHYAALSGMGISMHPVYMVAPDITSGRLQVVLPDHVPQQLGLYVVFASRKSITLRSRTFVNFLQAWFGRADWDETGAPAMPLALHGSQAESAACIK